MTTETIAREPKYTRTQKVNPNCLAERHKPGHDSAVRGCTCPATLAAESEWRDGRKEAIGRPRPTTILTPSNPECTAHRHNPTEDSWAKGCRCPGAVRAHEVKMAARRIEKANLRKLAATAAEFGCTSRAHGTLRMYFDGCRHPEARQKYEDRQRRRAEARGARRRREQKRSLERWLVWRGPERRVSRINLWMLVRGFVDSPTRAEMLAATIILSRRLVPNPDLGAVTKADIGRRLGVDGGEITRLWAERALAAKNRAQRRLADVRYKAVRVERAEGRKQREAERHTAAFARKWGAR